MFEEFARGSFRLTRFVFRRERLRILIWIAGLAGLSLFVPIVYSQILLSAGGTHGLYLAMQNPAMIAMVGPTAAGIDTYTVGAMNVHMMIVFMAMAVAVMNILMVVRHTRRDEELGRQEVIRSLPVGHMAPLNATIIMVVLVNLVLGAVIGLGLSLLGIGSIDLAGSMLYGLSLAAVGIVFAGIAAVFAQLSQTATGAVGWSMSFMIGSYLLRAVGDMNNETLSLISPLGLVMRTDAAVNNYWWPVWILITIAIVLFVKAIWLNSMRDMGSGFIPARSGRARASRLLVRPMGLSLRLVRGTMIAWAVGLVLLGASYGSIMGDTEQFSSIIAQVTGGSTDARDFVSILMRVMAVCATIPCLIIALKLRSEEKHGRMEGLLATPVSRWKIFSSYLIPSLVFSVAAPTLAVLGLWGASVTVMATPIPLGDMLHAVLVFLPAIWFTVGLAAVLIGIWPKRTSLVWAFLTFSFLVIYMGEMLKAAFTNFPTWIIQLTPFGHVSQSLIEPTNYTPLVITFAAAVVLLVIGCCTYKRRDMI